MKIIKWIGLLLLITLLGIQFIRPDRPPPAAAEGSDIIEAFHVPDDIAQMLRSSCYDCHSDATVYPWYAEIQPVGWWLANHIKAAHAELNFSEFGRYKPRRQLRKFIEISDQVELEEMPLPSYTIIHRDAILNLDQRERIMTWATAMKDSLDELYPPDTTRRR